MTQFINPPAICVVCGKHRNAKDVDHSACSKELQKRSNAKKPNAPQRYKSGNPAKYWEKDK